VPFFFQPVQNTGKTPPPRLRNYSCLTRILNPWRLSTHLAGRPSSLPDGPCRPAKKILAVFASFLPITHFESTKRSQNRVQKRTKTYRTRCFSGAFLLLSLLNFPKPPQSRTKTYRHFSRLPGSFAPAESGNSFFRIFGPFFRITHLESAKRFQNRVQKRTKTYRTADRATAGPQALGRSGEPGGEPVNLAESIHYRSASLSGSRRNSKPAPPPRRQRIRPG